MTAIQTVGVIGAGTMGNGIAQTFAVAGFPVVMQDLSQPALDRARATIAGSLDRLVKKDRLTAEAATAALARIVTTTTLDLMSDRDLVIEAIVERLEVKTTVIRQLDAICRPDAVLASNTSSISLTQLAAASAHPGRWPWAI